VPNLERPRSELDIGGLLAWSSAAERAVQAASPLSFHSQGLSLLHPERRQQGPRRAKRALAPVGAAKGCSRGTASERSPAKPSRSVQGPLACCRSLKPLPLRAGNCCLAESHSRDGASAGFEVASLPGVPLGGRARLSSLLMPHATLIVIPWSAFDSRPWSAARPPVDPGIDAESGSGSTAITSRSNQRLEHTSRAGQKLALLVGSHNGGPGHPRPADVFVTTGSGGSDISASVVRTRPRQRV